MKKSIVDVNGQPWNVVVKNENVINFYDARYNFTEHGQFVGSYYIDIILEDDYGLNLDGGIPEWSISDIGMNEIRSWLKNEVLVEN